MEEKQLFALLEKHGIEVASGDFFYVMVNDAFWEHYTANVGERRLNCTTTLLHIAIPIEKFLEFVKENPNFKTEELNNNFDFSRLLVEGIEEIKEGMELDIYYIKDSKELILFSTY